MTNADLNAALDGQRGQDLLLNAPEISVWMTAFGCLRQLSDIQEAYAAKRIGKEEYYGSCNQMLIELAETADATHRFSVLLPATIEPQHKKHAKELKDAFLKVTFSASFWRWYNWWDDYMKVRSHAERAQLYELVTHRLPDVDRFRPDCDWIGYRQDPALKLI